jgi:hypothetical protein
MNDAQLEQFYLNLVASFRSRGVLCGITSGLACVHFGIAETTKDCDLLCHEGHFTTFLDELSQTAPGGLPCSYRGTLSPPLDARWHRGGWTSHFTWDRGPNAVTLDVFGRALRGSTRWEEELDGLYISPHIVAEMKRTNRDKDWPFITALGAYLVEKGDPRGWLHLFDDGVIDELRQSFSCPNDVAARRPALRLALEKNARAKAALLAERLLWEELDALRIRIYEHALRPYNTAVRRTAFQKRASLHEDHQVRVQCAEQHLAQSPLKEYGLTRFVEEARQAAIVNAGLVADALQWMPDVTPNLTYLNE